MKRWNEGYHDKFKRHSLSGQLLDMRNLRKAWAKVKANRGSGGVDRESIESFGARLEQNLAETQRLLKGERYRPRPVRRVYIPKPDGRQRPLGIPTIRDRVVQQAMRDILEPIFEEIFLPNSHGYRAGKNAHQAVVKAEAYLNKGYGWVLDADIEGFFDHVDHRILMDLVREKVADGRILDLVEAFLKSGVMEEGEFAETMEGTPQGGVISPLLANIYLNHLDRRMGGEGFLLLRYADDCAPRNCTRDEGRPLGADLQEQAPNHLKLHWLRASVVSVEGKGMARPCQIRYEETSVNEPLKKCRKRRDDVKTGGQSLPQDKPRGDLLTAWVASGIKVA